MDTGVETHRLRQEIERALRRAFDPADVLPRLARLARLAPPSSDDGVFAHRQLAELLVERHPWRAALYARRALAHAPNDDRAWAVLAFCQTLLGNFRAAAQAYKQAIACAPANPWYAHNLGHLLDVALASPERALPWLRSAYGAKGDNSEIVASYVHALARAGRTTDARAILVRALERFESRELVALLRWLDQGAPSRRTLGGRTARPSRRRSADTTRSAPSQDHELAFEQKLGQERPRASRPIPPAAPSGEKLVRPRRNHRLARVLERGLSHLPLDSRQRERALVLAHDVLAEARAKTSPSKGATATTATTAKDAATVTTAKRSATKTKTKTKTGAAVATKPNASGVKTMRITGRAEPTSAIDLTALDGSANDENRDVAGLAAAVAYAIVYVDHVPLSQAEVAAPFRVAVARLRGRFAELRAQLDIIPGDSRYASF